MKKIIAFLVSVLLLIAIIFAYCYINVEYNIGVPCIFNKIFGLYCAGCGLTRASVAMMKLDFYQAFRYNAFSIILLPILFIFFVLTIWEWIFKKPSFLIKVPFPFWVILFSMLFVYGIVRNFIPYLQPCNIR